MFATIVFIGKDCNRDATLNLSDIEGNVRLQMKVDAMGNGQIRGGDVNGNVMSKFPLE